MPLLGMSDHDCILEHSHWGFLFQPGILQIRCMNLAASFLTTVWFWCFCLPKIAAFSVFGDKMPCLQDDSKGVLYHWYIIIMKKLILFSYKPGSLTLHSPRQRSGTYYSISFVSPIGKEWGKNILVCLLCQVFPEQHLGCRAPPDWGSDLVLLFTLSCASLHGKDHMVLVYLRPLINRGTGICPVAYNVAFLWAWPLYVSQNKKGARETNSG